MLFTNIINYLQVNTLTRNLYTDMYFWLILLDRDFIIENTQIKPSYYATTFKSNIEIGYQIYKRWYIWLSILKIDNIHISTSNPLYKRHEDIVLFMIHNHINHGITKPISILYGDTDHVLVRPMDVLHQTFTNKFKIRTQEAIIDEQIHILQ